MTVKKKTVFQIHPYSESSTTPSLMMLMNKLGLPMINTAVLLPNFFMHSNFLSPWDIRGRDNTALLHPL